MQKSEMMRKDETVLVQKTSDGEMSPILNTCQHVPWWIPSRCQQPHLLADTYHHHLAGSLKQLGHQNSSPQAGGKMVSGKGKEANIAAKSSLFEITLGQPNQQMVSVNHSQTPQLYGLFTDFGPQQTMGSVMLPMSLATEDGTVYVNPKQYNGILRRRKSRAKAALKAKPARNKPYVHESRHLHALRRPRGAGGRFLTTKELEGLKEKSVDSNKRMVMMMMKNKVSSNVGHRQLSNPSRSSSSEVLQSENAHLNPSHNPPGSLEVTSFLYARQFDWFQGKQEQLMSTATWDVVAASADHGCCDFLKV